MPDFKPPDSSKGQSQKPGQNGNPTRQPTPADFTRTLPLFSREGEDLLVQATSETVSNTDPLIGRIIDRRYLIERQIAKGGMGIVYYATHTGTGKGLAIKFISPKFIGNKEVVERFAQEARTPSRIDHENIVDTIDIGRLDDPPAIFLVMEYLKGNDLAETLKDNKRPFSWERAKNISLQFCRALQAAHEKGVIHRDIKPANIFIIKRSGKDFVKILDFGISKLRAEVERQESTTTEPTQPVTRTGMIMGTPEYMSPEQLRGEKVDHRTDIYAFGVTMYEMVTGIHPFSVKGGGNSPIIAGKTVLDRHEQKKIIPPHEILPTIPRVLSDVIMKALATDPNERFQSMQELETAIEQCSLEREILEPIMRETQSGPIQGISRFSVSPDDGALDVDLSGDGLTSNAPRSSSRFKKAVIFTSVLTVLGLGAITTWIVKRNTSVNNQHAQIAHIKPKPSLNTSNDLTKKAHLAPEPIRRQITSSTTSTQAPLQTPVRTPATQSSEPVPEQTQEQNVRSKRHHHRSKTEKRGQKIAQVKKHRIEFISKSPRDVSVYLGNEFLCTTSCWKLFPAGDTLTFTFRKKEYKERSAPVKITRNKTVKANLTR